MNWTNRYTLVALLLAIVLPIVATGCIVVVEEDDRDRHRLSSRIRMDARSSFLSNPNYAGR